MSDAWMMERFSLMKERIREISGEEVVKEPYGTYFKTTAAFIMQVADLHKKLQQGWLEGAELSELEANNQKLYEDILPQNYGHSYGNPTWAAETLGEEFGQLLSFLYTEIRGLIVFAYEDRLFDMTVAMELFVQIYNLFEAEEVSAKDVKEAIYWYVSDYSDEMVGRRVQEGVDPALDFAANIICSSDLTDIRYLYRFGEYITENEIGMAKFLNKFRLWHGLSQRATAPDLC